jgi:hypothetical protein
MAEEGTASYQFHFSRRTSLDPSVQHDFRAGEFSTESVCYEIGSLEALERKGFRTSAAVH